MRVPLVRYKNEKPERNPRKRPSRDNAASKTGAGKKSASPSSAASGIGPKSTPLNAREITIPQRLDPILPTDDFLARAAALDINFESDDITKLGTYLALLLAGNEIMNLTTITEPAEMWRRHILDSLTLLPLLASAGANSVIDIGSGGGLPGIPLAIVMPEVRFTLLESTGKKSAFLKLVVERLRLMNVSIVSNRAETAGRDRENHREMYDAAIIRAVGHLAIILELSIPFVREGGYVFAVKGERVAMEIEESKQALHMLHAEVTKTIPTETNTIVVIEKRRRTPKIYPRTPGEPKRAPLGLKKSR